MRVAIPTKNNRIDPQYSRAAEFTIYEIEIELVKKKEVVPLGENRHCGFSDRAGYQRGYLMQHPFLRPQYPAGKAN